MNGPITKETKMINKHIKIFKPNQDYKNANYNSHDYKFSLFVLYNWYKGNHIKIRKHILMIASEVCLMITSKSPILQLEKNNLQKKAP